MVVVGTCVATKYTQQVKLFASWCQKKAQGPVLKREVTPNYPHPKHALCKNAASTGVDVGGQPVRRRERAGMRLTAAGLGSKDARVLQRVL